MAEKRERQCGCSSNAPEAGADRSLYLTEVVCAEIGQFLPFDVAPYEFGRIEIGRVAGQAFHGQPRALRLQVRRHGAALMRRQAIPDEDETPTTKVPLELGQEADERDVVVTAGPRLEEETAAAEVPPERQAHGEGELRPVEGMDQDGGLPTRGPRAADGRPLRDAAFVLEDDPGPAPPSVFFTAGQRVVTQCRMAGSFRSFARLAGRCSVQSSAPKRRQTWPG
jgi:hypothetical protein